MTRTAPRFDILAAARYAPNAGNGASKRSRISLEEVFGENVFGLHQMKARLPKPQFASFRIKTLFNRVDELMHEKMEKKEIALKTMPGKENIELVADIHLLEKVLINLVNNAFEALEQTQNGKIMLKAMKNQDGTFIQVEDNGPGISSDIIDDIFVPFFTTKTNGSGIGLSLSRQIMLEHEGTLSVQSLQGIKTVFTLKF